MFILCPFSDLFHSHLCVLVYTQSGPNLVIIILSENYKTGLPIFFTRCVIPSITIQCIPAFPNYQGISQIYWQISLFPSFIKFSLILTPLPYALISLSHKISLQHKVSLIFISSGWNICTPPKSPLHHHPGDCL